MNILVTGGAGFVGQNLVKEIAARGDNVIAFDKYTSGIHEELKENSFVEIIEGDITDYKFLDEIVYKYNIEKIIHCSAIVGVSQSVDDPTLTTRINLIGSINIMEIARRYALKRVIEISSEEVYGAFEYEPIRENHPIKPYSPYGITKAASEWYAEYYHKYYGISYISLRTSYVYGPGLKKERTPRIFIKYALDKKPLRLACGANQRVDQIYVEDLIQGIICALDKEDPCYRIYNIGTGEGRSLAEVAEIVTDLITGADIKIGSGMYEFLPGFPSPQKGALDITRARSDLGYKPKYDLRAGIIKYIEHLKDNAF